MAEQRCGSSQNLARGPKETINNRKQSIAEASKEDPVLCSSGNSFQSLFAYRWRVRADVEQQLHGAESNGKPVLKRCFQSLPVVATDQMARVGANMQQSTHKVLQGQYG